MGEVDVAVDVQLPHRIARRNHTALSDVDAADGAVATQRCALLHADDGVAQVAVYRQATGLHRRRTGQAVVARQVQRTGTALDQRTVARQGVGEGGVGRLIDHQRRVVGDRSTAEGLSVTGQDAAVDHGAARVGVVAGQHQVTGAVLDQRAAAADVVAPGVDGVIAAQAGVHVDRDVGIERCVAIACCVQVQTAITAGLIDHRIARRNFSGCQDLAALTGVQIREAGFQQHFGADRHHGCQVGRANRVEAIGHARGVQRFVQRVLGGAVGGRVDGCHAIVDVAAALRGEVIQCLGAGVGAQLRVGRVGQVVDGKIGRGDAPAHHVERRVHAGFDAVVANLRGTQHQFAETLGNGVGQCVGRQIGCVGMPAGETRVAGRRGALRWAQGRRNHEGQALAVQALSPRARVQIMRFGWRGGRVVAHRADQIDHLAQRGSRTACAIAFVVVFDGFVAVIELRDGGESASACPVGRGQRAQAAGGAVALVTAVIEIGGGFLSQRARVGAVNHDLQVAPQQALPQRGRRAGVPGRAGCPQRVEAGKQVHTVDPVIT